MLSKPTDSLTIGTAPGPCIDPEHSGPGIGAGSIETVPVQPMKSGVDFAAHMGVAPETVSRWESGAASMGTQGDRLLRLMVLSKEPVRDYSLEMLKDVAQDDASPLRLGMRSDANGWHAEAA